MSNPEITPESVKRMFGDPQEVAKKLERFKQNALFFEEHREQLKATLSDQYVAVYGQAVIGASTNLKELLPRLREQGISPAEAFISFLPAKDSSNTYLSLNYIFAAFPRGPVM